jgi:hypothetical protein
MTCLKRCQLLDEISNSLYNKKLWRTKVSKETVHESITIHSQALCQVPDRSAQRPHLYHLRKSKTQTTTGIADHGEN